MISSIRRASRIKKLLDPLMDYLSSLPSIRETYRRENRSGETVIDAVVFRAVWVTEGDPSPIDDYIALNPNHPNRSDLREIESWKSGISHEFPVIRSEGVVLFLYGDHVSAVRGIDDEIDTRADLPTYIFTVILSFDGLITYGLAMKVATNDHDPAVDASFSTVELMCARRQRVSVRTARQFLKAAPVARELKRQAAPEDGDLGQAPSDPAGGTARAAEGEAHTGSLPTADTAPSLSLAKSVVSPLRGQAFALYDELCEGGPAIETLEDAYRGMSRDESAVMAKAMGLKVPRARMRDRTSPVKTLASATDATARYVLTKAMKQGAIPRSSSSASLSMGAGSSSRQGTSTPSRTSASPSHPTSPLPHRRDVRDGDAKGGRGGSREHRLGRCGQTREGHPTASSTPSPRWWTSGAW